MRLLRGCGSTLILLGSAVCATALPLHGAPSDGGFNAVIRPDFTGEEIRTQPDLWGLEISLKPVRMVYVPIPKPRTGTKSSEIVWYLVYKIVNRPVSKLGNAGDSVPVNVEDAPPPPMFVPKAVLVTEDRDLHQAVADSIVPEALQAIVARERLELKTSVQIAGELPKLTPVGDPHENAKYGVFMFRGVSPRTTVFSIYLSGFTNAYKIGKNESGGQLVLRRTAVISYKRPADEFDQFEKEIRQTKEPKWIYVPDEGPQAK